MIDDHVTAVNAFDIDAIVATFAPDAYVNDARREIRGTDAIRRFVEREIVGDNVTMDVIEVSTITATRSSAPCMTATSTRPTCPTRWC